jgi:(p)ppGpp synthase/HD superfamily hydrolase
MTVKDLNVDFEHAIRLLTQLAPISDEKSRKALLPHDIRVGVYLYENGYSRDIILAGILHDTLEFTTVTEQMLKDEFGDDVLKLVKASTKDDSIKDKEEKTNELIKRCAENGQDALIVKTADIIDSFKYYTAVENADQLEYCLRNARAIFKFKPDNFSDKIFEELEKWYKN